jgi:hypothetical protein
MDRRSGLAIGAGMAGLWLFAVTVTSSIVIWSFRAPVAVYFDTPAWPRVLAVISTTGLFLPAGFYGLAVVRSRGRIEE